MVVRIHLFNLRPWSGGRGRLTYIVPQSGRPPSQTFETPFLRGPGNPQTIRLQSSRSLIDGVTMAMTRESGVITKINVSPFVKGKRSTSNLLSSMLLSSTSQMRPFQPQLFPPLTCTYSFLPRVYHPPKSKRPVGGRLHTRISRAHTTPGFLTLASISPSFGFSGFLHTTIFYSLRLRSHSPTQVLAVYTHRRW